MDGEEMRLGTLRAPAVELAWGSSIGWQERRIVMAYVDVVFGTESIAVHKRPRHHVDRFLIAGDRPEASSESSTRLTINP